MKYKVGDRVQIKSIDWYNENKDEDGYVDCGRCCFDEALSTLCGKVITIKTVFDDYYWANDNLYASWTDEMIEGLVEEEDKPKYEDEVNGEYYSTPKYLVRPNGYQFKDENGNVINAMKIVLEKKKKEYPKTYEECCEVLGTSGSELLFEATKATIYEITRTQLIDKLYRLLICRDAYWKIAGEEMGLGKPWEPDWLDDSKIKCGLRVCRGSIQVYDSAVWGVLLSFPTEEMRDVFYENFKELIESVKELL